MKWVMLYVHNLRGRFQVSLQIQERICTKIKFGVENETRVAIVIILRCTMTVVLDFC